MQNRRKRKKSRLISAVSIAVTAAAAGALIWLFLSAATLIMGAEVNGMIQQWHQNRHYRPEEGGYDRV